MHRFALTLFAMLLLAIGVAGFSYAARAAEKTDLAISWAASALMTIEQWYENTVTTAFAKRTLARARTELDKETDKVRSDTKEGDAFALRELDLMANLQHAVEEVSNALVVDDRPRVRAGIEALRVATAQLNDATSTLKQ
jgi:hypothetical protein